MGTFSDHLIRHNRVDPLFLSTVWQEKILVLEGLDSGERSGIETSRNTKGLMGV
jgi:hypothetical protein